MPAPTITVVMPAYNAQKYLRAAVDSVLNQTFTDFELLIVNDGSTDDTEAIVQSYSDPRIRYYANETNIGFCATFNRALHLARGRFIADADSDDIAHPQRLAIQVEFLQSHPTVAAVGSDLMKFSQSPPPFSIIKNGERHAVAHTAEQNRSRQVFELGPCVPMPTLMMRADSLRKHEFRFDPRWRIAGDYDFIMRLIGQIDVVQLRSSLVLYRWHGENNSASAVEGLREVRAIWEEDCRALLDMDGSEIWGEDGKLPDIAAYYKFEAVAESAIAKFADDPRFDRAELHYRAAGKLYGQLRQLEKAWHDFADIYDAYRRSKLLRNIRINRRARLHAKAVLGRVGLYR